MCLPRSSRDPSRRRRCPFSSPFSPLTAPTPPRGGDTSASLFNALLVILVRLSNSVLGDFLLFLLVMETPVWQNCVRSQSFPPSTPSPFCLSSSSSAAPLSSDRLAWLNQQKKEGRASKKALEVNFSSLKNPHGRQHSTEENRLLLAMLHGVMLSDDVDAPKACRVLSQYSGVHYSTLSSLYASWCESGEVPSPDSSKRGKGNPSHPLYLEPFPLEAEQAIHRVIEESNQKKGFVNTVDIQTALNENFSIEISRSALVKRLHTMGYRWGRTRSRGSMS